MAATAGVVTMTEGGPRTQGRPEPAAGGAERRAARPAPARSPAHPLLRVFPLTVMTLAMFLTVFTLLMARMTTIQPLPSQTGTRAVALVGGAPAVRARTSGAAVGSAGGATPGGAAGAPAQRPAAVSTHSSGARLGERDD